MPRCYQTKQKLLIIKQLYKMENTKELETNKQCDMHVVMCSLLVEMQETIDYLKESRDYWIKNGEYKKVIAYNTCISQMEDVLSGYKNYT